MQLSFKKDTYKNTRGTRSRFFDICCRKCGHAVAVYQKDGPGHLRRLYMDRIFAPQELRAVTTKELSTIPPLSCSHCGEILGVPTIYEKENRKIFRLFVDAVTKRLRKKG